MRKWKFTRKLYYPTKHQNFRKQGKNFIQSMLFPPIMSVAVHLGVKMADTLSFTDKVDMVNFWI